MTEKVRENRLRRMAHRQGYKLVKSRLRDPRALGYGDYALLDNESSLIKFGRGPSGQPWATLDEIEKFLTSDDPQRSQL